MNLFSRKLIFSFIEKQLRPYTEHRSRRIWKAITGNDFTFTSCIVRVEHNISQCSFSIEDVILQRAGNSLLFNFSTPLIKYQECSKEVIS